MRAHIRHKKKVYGIQMNRVLLARATRVRRERLEHVKITRTRMDRELEEAII